MELIKLMKDRRSIRKYRGIPVSLEAVCQILEAGRHAPSGANLQPWVYIVVTEKGIKERIRKECERVERKFHREAPERFKAWLKEQGITPEKSFLTDAPILVVVAAYTKAPYWLESTWISIAYILLSVQSRGLGTLTYTPSETGFLNEILGLPADYRPVAILPIGYPAETPSPSMRPRKPLEQIVYLNRYGNRLVDRRRGEAETEG
ncbi:nitroreductase family protein [Candidatus Bathyarchaeota archaeon]|nr:MAG: nitroreductase family protein [Candidatus Bathyarchaeota archaeon]